MSPNSLIHVCNLVVTNILGHLMLHAFFKTSYKLTATNLIPGHKENKLRIFLYFSVINYKNDLIFMSIVVLVCS